MSHLAEDRRLSCNVFRRITERQNQSGSGVTLGMFGRIYVRTYCSNGRKNLAVPAEGRRLSVCVLYCRNGRTNLEAALRQKRKGVFTYLLAYLLTYCRNGRRNLAAAAYV